MADNNNHASRPVRIGIIGYGYWGPNLTRNFTEINSSEVVVVADFDADRLAAMRSKYPGVQTTATYQDFWDMDLDAVVVATPPPTHYAIAKDCLEHGLHVLVEKPITLNSAHAEELIALAEAKDLRLMVGHTFEYNAAVRKMKAIIESGELGEIYTINAQRLNLGLIQRNLNVLWDLAPHDISILLYILGMDPVSVTAHGTSYVAHTVEDVAHMHLVFPNNIRAHIHVSWLDPLKVRQITVVGSKKMLVYDDVAPLEKIKIYDKGVEKLPYTDTFGDFQYSYRYGDIIIPRINFSEPLRIECQHFIDCIQNGSAPQSDGRIGLKVVRILEQADRALAASRDAETAQESE